MSDIKQLALIVADFSGESKEELNVNKNDVVTFIKDEGDVIYYITPLIFTFLLCRVGLLLNLMV